MADICRLNSKYILFVFYSNQISLQFVPNDPIDRDRHSSIDGPVPWRIYFNRLQGVTWWRHQMETFSALLVLCAGNSPVTGEFPSQSPVTWSFDVFFDLGLNKRLSKHSRRRWFETPSRSLWRHCNEYSEAPSINNAFTACMATRKFYAYATRNPFY